MKASPQLQALSALVSRMSIAAQMGQSYDGDRDVYTALGYPKDITFRDYYNKYKRQDIAKRIVEAPVSASWRKNPELKDKESTKNDDGKMSVFEKAWLDFEQEYKVYHYLSRADKISGIGRYAVVLLGFDDGEELTEELTKASKLLYMRPYSEGNAIVDKWEIDTTSPRYGKPLLYKVTTTVDKNSSSTKDIYVHWSRVLHITDDALDDDFYGTPRLKSVFNRLLNLELLTGGSAEMFWRGAFPGYSFELDPEAQPPVAGSQEATDFQDEVDEYMHGLKRYLQLQGIKVNPLTPQVADPTNHVDVQLTMISIATGIPKRILMGSERGELSSNQDAVTWNDKADERRRDFVEPWLLRPFVDKMIELKILPEPKGGYEVFWPDLQLPSDKERAEVAKIRTEAFAKYASTPGADILIPPEKYLQYIMEMDVDEIQDIMAAMEDALAEEIKEQKDMERIAREEQARVDKEAAAAAAKAQTTEPAPRASRTRKVPVK